MEIKKYHLAGIGNAKSTYLPYNTKNANMAVILLIQQDSSVL